jgi:hypothetical protein
MLIDVLSHDELDFCWMENNCITALCREKEEKQVILMSFEREREGERESMSGGNATQRKILQGSSSSDYQRNSGTHIVSIFNHYF